MGSRIKQNPQRIFDLFFEAAHPTPADDDPQVLRQFPLEFDDQESIQMLPRFCFPFDLERVKESPIVQHFTFALTDMEGKQRFGFCRLAIGFHRCLCILSYLPWFEVFYKILNYVADNLAKKQITELDEFLSALYIHPVPNLSGSISLEFDPRMTKLKISTEFDQNRQDWKQDLNSGAVSAYFIVPDHGKLPTIPENVRQVAVLQSFGTGGWACANFSLAILQSMEWERTPPRNVQAQSRGSRQEEVLLCFLPRIQGGLGLNLELAMTCLSFLNSAPMPYLIGVHTSLMERVRSKALEDVVILNIDSNTVESPFQDLESLPSDIVSLLKFQLKKQSASTGDGVAQAFLRAQALLFGSYREALVCNPGEPISFCQDSFLQQGSSAMQAFLQRAVHLQLFKEFIDDRLEKLNAGENFSDLFEEEINRSLSPGSMHSYQQWVENLKKGGGALISTMKNKANPAVRNAYQYAKGHAKMRLKNMRSRLMEKDTSSDQHREREHSLNCDHTSSSILPTRSRQSENLQSRLPITQHFGKSRPRRPQRQRSRTELETQGGVSISSSSMSLDSSREPDEGENLHPGFFSPGDFDLLGEIFETLNLLEPSQAGRPLYGTRSLDFCNLEEGNFYTKLKPSRETLYESLPEEQDDSDSLSGDVKFPPSLDPENVQSALLLSTKVADECSERWEHGGPEPQEAPGTQMAGVFLQEEKGQEEGVTASNYGLARAAWIQPADYEASHPTANRTQSSAGPKSEQDSGADQSVEPLPAISSPKPPSCCSSQSSAPLSQTEVKVDTDIRAKEGIPVLGQATEIQSPAASRCRVSELKKRFET
ncbi:DENN domain-containing protein 1C [Varanus komodoensis]|uniref:DENN domain-containing protein 1C n=1 Tax=Varanus komodoensis TaxID=61221 RepID=UPI001CF79956|nr:DENN domain-containing protein 1C [Varanus komodoensis]